MSTLLLLLLASILGHLSWLTTVPRPLFIQRPLSFGILSLTNPTPAETGVNYCYPSFTMTCTDASVGTGSYHWVVSASASLTFPIVSDNTSLPSYTISAPESVAFSPGSTYYAQVSTSGRPGGDLTSAIISFTAHASDIPTFTSPSSGAGAVPVTYWNFITTGLAPLCYNGSGAIDFQLTLSSDPAFASPLFTYQVGSSLEFSAPPPYGHSWDEYAVNILSLNQGWLDPGVGYLLRGRDGTTGGWSAALPFTASGAEVHVVMADTDTSAGHILPEVRRYDVSSMSYLGSYGNTGLGNYYAGGISFVYNDTLAQGEVWVAGAGGIVGRFTLSWTFIALLTSPPPSDVTGICVNNTGQYTHVWVSTQAGDVYTYQTDGTYIGQLNSWQPTGPGPHPTDSPPSGKVGNPSASVYDVLFSTQNMPAAGAGGAFGIIRARDFKNETNTFSGFAINPTGLAPVNFPTGCYAYKGTMWVCSYMNDALAQLQLDSNATTLQYQAADPMHDAMNVPIDLCVVNDMVWVANWGSNSLSFIPVNSITTGMNSGLLTAVIAGHTLLPFGINVVPTSVSV